MTNAARFKRQVRERSARTGESYAAARAQLDSKAAPAPQLAPPPIGRSRMSNGAPAVADPTFVAPPRTYDDARYIEKTGSDAATWFALLDAVDPGKTGHTGRTRWVQAHHPEVDAWWIQSLVVEYERAHGLRRVNQSLAGDFQVSASKTIAVPLAALAAWLADPAHLPAVTGGATPVLAGALGAALGQPDAVRFREGKDVRVRLRHGVHIDLGTRAARSGTTITLTASRMPDQAAVGQWRADLKALLAAWDAALAT